MLLIAYSTENKSAPCLSTRLLTEFSKNRASAMPIFSFLFPLVTDASAFVIAPLCAASE
jgi:hypothetical protein